MRTSRPRAARRGAARASAPVARHVETVEQRILFATFFVTNTNDAGAGSFRQAITDANNAPNPADDVDYILFNIPGAGVHTITPLSPLPTVTGIVTIDATGDDLVTPTVELNGSQAGAAADGLVLASSDTVLASFVAGLIINRFSGNGIKITGDSNGIGLNYIGTNAAGTAAGPGNGGAGILIQSSGNFASDNVIAFNTGAGVAVASGAGNDVGINNIFQNGGLGIDLGNNGRTANDANDADTGANDLQNFPTITATVRPAGGVTISGTINSEANVDLDIALYSNPAGGDEGQTFLLHFPVRTDASGNATFTQDLPTASQTDSYTATATELFVLPNNETFAINTSEFSDPATPGGTGGNPVVTRVFARGSTWTLSDNLPNVTFMEYLESQALGDKNLGYEIKPKAAGSEDLLPWVNVNQVVLEYDKTLTAAPAASTIIVDGVRADYTGTTSLLDPTHVLLQLDRPLGTSAAGTTTTATNGDRFTLNVTGGAASNGTFSLKFNLLQGDVDKSRTVVAQDFSEVKAKFFKSTNAPGSGATGYTPFHDVDGSGQIVAADFSAVKARFFHGLPPAPAAAGASVVGITEDLFGGTAIL
jgi:hypothetical protein